MPPTRFRFIIVGQTPSINQKSWLLIRSIYFVKANEEQVKPSFLGFSGGLVLDSIIAFGNCGIVVLLHETNFSVNLNTFNLNTD